MTELRGIAYVPEGRELFPELTVLENLQAGAFTRSDDITPDLQKMFHHFPRLAERRTQWAGTLSGGEQQMLAIARALMGKPRLLMLDEPSLGLSPRWSKRSSPSCAPSTRKASRSF